MFCLECFALTKTVLNIPSSIDVIFVQSPRKALAPTQLETTTKLPKLDFGKELATPNKDNDKSFAKDDGTVSKLDGEPVMEFNPELEPLLRENPRRFVIFPIEYEDIWKMYKKVTVYYRQYMVIKDISIASVKKTFNCANLQVYYTNIIIYFNLRFI